MGIAVTLVLALVLGVFAIANPQPVLLSLWPMGYDAQLALWQAARLMEAEIALREAKA